MENLFEDCTLQICLGCEDVEVKVSFKLISSWLIVVLLNVHTTLFN